LEGDHQEGVREVEEIAYHPGEVEPSDQDGWEVGGAPEGAGHPLGVEHQAVAHGKLVAEVPLGTEEEVPLGIGKV
jgi:hypothetical protein